MFVIFFTINKLITVYFAGLSRHFCTGIQVLCVISVREVTVHALGLFNSLVLPGINVSLNNVFSLIIISFR